MFVISIANVCRDANSVKHSRFFQNLNAVKNLLIIILEVTRRLQLKTSKRRNRQYSGAAENSNILIKNDGNECGFFFLIFEYESLNEIKYHAERLLLHTVPHI